MDLPYRGWIILILVIWFLRSERGQRLMEGLHAFAGEYNSVYTDGDDDDEPSDKKES